MKWMFSDTTSAPRLFGICCLEDPVCYQSQEYDWVSKSF